MKYCNPMVMPKIFLIEKKYFLYQLQDRIKANPRNINYWKKKGLIDMDDKPVGNKDYGWHKYSIKELVWLMMIVEFRNFGVGTKTILLTKELFFNSVDFELLSPDNYYVFIIYKNKKNKMVADIIYGSKEHIKEKKIEYEVFSTFYFPINKLYNECLKSLKIPNE